MCLCFGCLSSIVKLICYICVLEDDDRKMVLLMHLVHPNIFVFFCKQHGAQRLPVFFLGKIHPGPFRAVVFNWKESLCLTFC